VIKRKTLSKAARLRIRAKTHGRCAYCGCKLGDKGWAVDHVVAISRGGVDDESNMLPTCRSCNHRKGTSSLENFRKQV